MAHAVILMTASRGCWIFGIRNSIYPDVAFSVPA